MKQLRSTVALAALAALGIAAIAGYASAGQTTVTLTPNGPQPRRVTANVGDTIVFMNTDNENHSIVSTQSAVSFTSPVILPGQTFTLALQTAGRVKYAQTGFHKSYHGSITVHLAGTLQLAAQQRTVAFGGALLLHGQTSLPGSAVVLSARAAGQHWADVGNVPVAPDGTFTTTVYPQLATSYRVSSGSHKIASNAVSVTVAPRLAIRAAPLVGRTGRAVVFSGDVVPADAATAMSLMRLDTSTHLWRTVARRAVSTRGRAVFRWVASPGTTVLRLSVAKRQVRKGLAAATSPQVSVKGIGPAPKPPAKRAAHRAGAKHAAAKPKPAKKK